MGLFVKGQSIRFSAGNDKHEIILRELIYE